MQSEGSPSGQEGSNRPPGDCAPGNGGRGGGRDPQGGRGGRRRGNHRDNRGDDGNRRTPFTGRESAMNGHIFDYTGERTPEKYIRTMRELVAHVGLTYKNYTTELKEGLENLTLVDPTEPENPPAGDQVAFKLWKMDLKEYREKLKVYANFRAGLYSLVLGQCTDTLQERLKSHHDYLRASQDGIALLVIIRSLIHTFEENRKLSDAFMDVKEKFYKFYQGRHMTLERYHELFLAQTEVLDKVGITIEDEALVEEVAGENGRIEPNDDDRREAQDQELAIRFIRGTNQNHKGYLRHLRNSFPGQCMRHTTSCGGVKRKLQPKVSRVMGYRLHKLGSSGTCQILDVTAVNRWDITPTHQSARITREIRTKTTTQGLGAPAGPHKEGAA